MKRFFMSLAIAAASLALAACAGPQENQKPPQQVAATPASGKSAMEMEYDLRVKEMDHRHTKTLALIRFADQSKSPYAMGVVSGLLSGGDGTATPRAGGSFMDAQVAQERLALQRYAMDSQNSWWNRGLQVFDRTLDIFKFSKGLKFQEFQLTNSANQDRYLWDTMRGTQQDGYSFGSNAYTAGSTATLGGVSAGAAAAGIGARAVAGAISGETTPASGATTEATTE